MKMKLPDNDRYFVFAGTSMLANRIQAVGSTVIESITYKQWHILLIVRDMPKGSSLTDIATQHGSSRQNVKKLLHSLAEQGYVEILMDEADKRSSAVYLTEKGTEVMLQVSRVGEEFVNTIFSGIGDEDVAAARRVIMQLFTNLEQYSGRREKL